MKFFADTFALIEYLKDNPSYVPYFEKHEIITSKLNLMELYYSSLKEVSEELAERHYNAFLPRTVDITDAHFKSAAKMRLKQKENNLSYVDCTGYSIAQENNIKFLTGDKQFKGMKNVEWIGKAI